MNLTCSKSTKTRDLNAAFSNPFLYFGQIFAAHRNNLDNN